MDPVTIAALIGAGTSLTGGLMGQAAQRQKEKRQALLDAERQRYQSQIDAVQGQSDSQRAIFNQLMSSYTANRL